MTTHTPEKHAEVWHGSHKAQIWRAYEHAAQDRDRLREINAELLEALKNVMRAHTADIETYSEGEFALEAWSQAEAAIAKAEGTDQ